MAGAFIQALTQSLCFDFERHQSRIASKRHGRFSQAYSALAQCRHAPRLRVRRTPTIWKR